MTIPSFLLGPIGFIRQWLPLITLAIGVAFGLWFHSLLDSKSALKEANTVIKETGEAIEAGHDRQLGRAKENDARETREQDLTTDLGKAIAKDPDSYRGAVPVDSVRILNAL